VRAPRHLVASEADLAVVRRHHVAFYAVLLLAPVEWWWRGRPAGAVQLLGAVLGIAGVVGYRRAGRALGDQLSPLVAPSEPAELVARGPYGAIRHPMYLAEIALAVGVPLLLGARVSLLASAAFVVLVLRRIQIEEESLAARLPAYAAYAARTHRLVPHVY
jgi:protein-S-isoprenylcysteine O-methyltransferase Ste14